MQYPIVVKSNKNEIKKKTPNLTRFNITQMVYSTKTCVAYFHLPMTFKA